MNLDFALLIASLVFLSGILSLLDIVIFEPKTSTVGTCFRCNTKNAADF